VATVRREAETFGRGLRKVQLKRGLSQQALAERCGSNILHQRARARTEGTDAYDDLRLASKLKCKGSRLDARVRHGATRFVSRVAVRSLLC
jgi:transcriptional regulator with XRE-family HTH domain